MATDESHSKSSFWGLIQTDAESMEREIQEATRQEVFNANFSEGRVCSSVSHQGITDKKCCGSKLVVTTVSSKPAAVEQRSTRSARSREKKPNRNGRNKTSQQKSKNKKPDIIADVSSPTRLPRSSKPRTATRNATTAAQCGPASTQHRTSPTDQDAKVQAAEEGSSALGTGAKGQDDQSKSTATVRFRWAKTLTTEAEFVGLKAGFTDAHIVLSWKPEKQAYESREIQVPCGTRSGKLIVDKRSHQVEPLTVQFYSFEVDIYIVEDEAEEPVNAGNGKRESQTARPNSSTPADRPSSSGARPDSSTPADRPSSSVPGARPNSSTSGSRPTSSSQVDRPRSSTPGARPSSSGPRSNSSTPGARPSSSAPERRPNSFTPVDRPTSSTPGSRPNSSTPGARLSSSAPGSRPNSSRSGSATLAVRPKSSSSTQREVAPENPAAPHGILTTSGQVLLTHPDIANMEDFQDTENELDLSTDSGSIIRSNLLENLVRQQLAKSDGNLNNNVQTSSVKSELSARSQSGDRAKQEYATDSYRSNKLYRSQEFQPVTNGNHRGHGDREYKSVNSSEVELSHYFDQSGRRSVDHAVDTGRLSRGSYRSSDRLSSASQPRDHYTDRHGQSPDGARYHNGRRNVDFDDHRRDYYQTRDYNDNDVHREKTRDQYADSDSNRGSRPSSRQSSSSLPPPRQYDRSSDRQGPLRMSPGPERSSPGARRRLYDSDPGMEAGAEDGEDLTPVSTPPRGHSQEFRSSTPDDQQQQPPQQQQQQRPAMRPSLVTSRTTPVSSSRSSSRASGRDVPDVHRMQDLEDTILSLKRVLNEREREVDELKATNRAVEGDLHQLMTCKKDLEVRLRGRSTLSGGSEGEGLTQTQPQSSPPLMSHEHDEHEQRVNDLIREKENMATELWKLRQELEKLSGVTAATKNQSAQGEAEIQHSAGGATHIDSYQPGSAAVLQKKLEDAKAHVQDLEEANESSASHLKQAEREIVALKEGNERLRRSLGGHDLQGLEQENVTLRQQLERLTDEHTRAMVSRNPGGARKDPGYLQQEIGQLREDLRSLRDKNHQLVQDNIKLTEHLKDVERRGETVGYRGRHRDDKYSSQSYRETRYSSSSFTERREPSHRENSSLSHSREEARERTPSGEYRDFQEPPPLRVGDELDRVDSRRERRISEASNSTVELTSAPPTGEEEKYESHDYKETESSPSKHAARTNTATLSGSQRYTTESRMPEFLDDEEDYSQLPPSERVGDVLDNLSYPPLHRGRNRHEVVEDMTSESNTRGQQRKRPEARLQNGHEHLNSMGQPIPSIDRDRATPIKSEEICDEFILHGNHGNTMMMNGHDVSFIGDDLSPPPSPQPNEKGSRGESFSSDKTIIADELGLEESTKDRRGSMDSDSTEALLCEAEREIELSVTGGRDIEPKQDRGRPATKGHTIQPSLSPSPPGTPNGLRSVSPRPIITQHNKHHYTDHSGHDRRDSTNSFGHSSLTAGRRPFAPRSPADIQLGDVVKFSRQGGKISRGTVRYVGHLPGKNDTYLGVELEHEIGKHDGMYENQRYFQSKPNKGVFVAFTKVVMVWGE